MANYTDGIFDNPVRSGPPIVSYPLSLEDPTHKLIVQPMLSYPQTYSGPPLNAPHPNFEGSYCVGDQSVTSVGPLLKFERIYATLPQSGDYWTTATVTFPAYTGANTEYTIMQLGTSIIWTWDAAVARVYPITLTVPVRQERTYFIPGVIGGYSNLYDVPRNYEYQPNVDSVLAAADSTEYATWIEENLEIVVGATEIQRYRGEIWRAQTTWTKAQ